MTAIEYLKARGLVILAVGVGVGVIFPPLALAVRPLLTVAVVIFLFATFVRVDVNKIKNVVTSPRVNLAFPTIIMLVTPVVLTLGARAFGLESGLVAAVALNAVAPPSTGNAAIARSLGSDHSAALAIILICTVAAPISVPILARELADQQVPATILARNIGLMVGGTGLVSLFLLRFAKRTVDRSAAALDLLAMLALVLFAIAAMEGVQAQILERPGRSAQIILLAYGINLGLQIVGIALGQGSFDQRIAFGFSVGNRNVGLIWAALGASISPEISFYFAVCQFPFFTLPFIIQKTRPWRNRSSIIQ